MPAATKKRATEMKLGQQFRAMQITRAEVNEDTRTVELSFSSEDPAERWWGIEILDHKKKSIRLDRLKAGGALLVDHRTSDHVGVVEKVWIEGRRGKAVVRFGKGARAEEIYQDVLDGIRHFVSVGYWIHRLVLEVEQDDGLNTYRATDWEPLEISIVAVPMDVTVGVGRQAAAEERAVPVELSPELADDNSEPPAAGDAEGNDVNEEEKRKMPELQTKSPEAAAEEKKAREEARNEERTRVRTILEIGARFGQADLADKYIQDGKSVDEFRTAVLEIMGDREEPQASTNSDGTRELGLNSKDKKRFSFMRLVNYLSDKGSASGKSAAGFEIEVCQAWAQKSGHEVHEMGAVVPPDLLYGSRFFHGDEGGLPEQLQRKLTGQRLVSDTTEGADMTPIDYMGASFVDLLRAATPVTQLAMLLTGLSGDVHIPKQTGGAAAAFNSESGTLGEQTATFGQITATPNRLGAFTEVTRRSMIQFNPAIENLLRLDLLIAVAQKLEQVAIQGGGVNEPNGILNTAGIGDVNIGTDGGALTWPLVVEFETDVDTSNALIANMAYVTTPGVVGKMKTTPKESGQAIYLLGDDGRANTYPVFRTTNVPSNLTKGSGTNLHAKIFANWTDLLLFLWDTTEIIVNPYIKDTQGIVRITAQHEVDVQVRRAESFSACDEVDVA